MADLIAMLSAAAGVDGGAAADPFFNQTTLLLHGDGTNGAQNNTFLDSSTNTFTITRNGNTTQGTFSPFSVADGEWSNYFDGSGDGLVFGNETAFSMGTGNFTWEAWIYLDQIPSVFHPIIDVNSGSNGRLAFYVNSSAQLGLDNFSAGIATSTGTVTANTWQHVAIVRSGTGSNQCVFYINGVSAGTATISTDFTNNKAHVGRDGSGTYTMKGYISNARIVKGTAVYTAAFTPPTSPLTAIANTSLLTCQSNRFVDNSTNNFAITVNGNTSVQPFSPFAPSAAYSTSVNGGSGYFDGSIDSLTVPDNAVFDFGTNNFTLEAWVYINGAISGDQYILNYVSTGTPAHIGLNIYNSGWRLGGFNGQLVTGSTNLTTGQWIHVALVRNGNTLYGYANGVQIGTVSVTGVSFDCAGTVYIGRHYANNLADFNGYISNLRIVKGTAVYTAAFTPPTAPLTAIANTSLLTNFTNAGIFDNTGKNNLETVGNAQIDTSVKKYGTGSMEFDGTGDYLAMGGGQANNFAFGTGNFTVEFWLYLNTTSGTPIIYDGRPPSTNGAQPTIYMNGAVITYFTNNANRITGSSLSTSTWYHIGLTRSGTDTKLFVDGTQVGSTYTDSTNYTNATNRPLIGVDSASGNTNYFNGYIDDLRITKGVARYTAAFTPPTAAFPDL